MKYTITYARVIVMTTTVEATNEGEAYTKAATLDIHGALGPATVVAKAGSTIERITDYDAIWSAKPMLDEDPEEDPEED